MLIRAILALCARDMGNDSMYAALRNQMAQFELQAAPWEMLVHRAEEQGVAPLLLKHLRLADWAVPRPTLRLLQSLALRTRQANLLRNDAVAEILRVCHAKNIEVVLAKGIALANLIYSDPGLRPMRDIDLLVGETDLIKMQAVLADLGYVAEDREDIPVDYYHLVPMAKVVEGLPITIEVHRNLLPYHPQYPPWPLERCHDALALSIAGVDANTLCLEDMLWHVYLHGFQAPLTYEPFRLVHLADVISLVEQRWQQMNWRAVHNNWSVAREVLSSLHCLTPWSEAVVCNLQLRVAMTPSRPGEPYQGWPQRRLQDTPVRYLPQLIRDTLHPSPWWLQVYYGCLPGAGLAKARWFTHPRMLYRWIKAYGLHFIRRRT